MEWISVEDRLPKSEDNSVLVYFSENGGIGMVHIQDYFDDITAGLDKDGKQLYTKWYLSQGVTHWAELPEPPKQNYLKCDKCGSLTEYKKRPKSGRWVCTNVDCGHSVVEEVE